MVQRRGRTHPALRLERVSSWQRKTRRGVADANVYVEKASGARHDRPVLKRALVACEKAACYKLDRVGRSLVHLTKVLAEPEKHGVHFMTTEDGLSTKGWTGKLVLHIIGAIPSSSAASS